MNNSEKALMYDTLIREGDQLNRTKSKLKSKINLTNEEMKELELIDDRLRVLEQRLNNLLQ
jgi:hypothetical protein